MSHSPSAPEAEDQSQEQPVPAEGQPPLATSEPQPSYVKLAMRNMVKKRRTSLFHFALTTAGLLALLVGLAYLTR